MGGLMESKELISVIIPVYKAEKYLNRCVESIVNQTYKNLEVILIDDGSPDRCGEICDEWAQKDSRIIVFHKENAGPGTARNIGLANASGKYIMFVDADDAVENNFASLLLAGVEGYDFCFGAYYRVVNNDLSSKRVVRSMLTSDKASELFSNYLGIRAYVSLVNSIFLKDIIDDNDIRFMDGWYAGEDVLFITNYLVYCKKVKYINKPIYTYYYVYKFKESNSFFDLVKSPYWTVYETVKKRGMTEYIRAFECGKFPLMVAFNIVKIVKTSCSYDNFFVMLSRMGDQVSYLDNARLKNLRFHIWFKITVIRILVRYFPRFLFYLLKGVGSSN